MVYDAKLQHKNQARFTQEVEVSAWYDKFTYIIVKFDVFSPCLAMWRLRFIHFFFLLTHAASLFFSAPIVYNSCYVFSRQTLLNCPCRWPLFSLILSADLVFYFCVGACVLTFLLA